MLNAYGLRWKGKRKTTMKIILITLLILSFDVFGADNICEGEKYVTIRHDDISRENALVIADLALKKVGGTFDESARSYSFSGEPNNIVYFKLDFEYGDEVTILNFIKCGSENTETYNKKIQLMKLIVKKLKHIAKHEGYSISQTEYLDSVIFVTEKPIFD